MLCREVQQSLLKQVLLYMCYNIIAIMALYLGCQVDVVRRFAFEVIRTELVAWIREASHYEISPDNEQSPTGVFFLHADSIDL